MAMSTTRENQSWTEYWRTGASVSCIAGAEVETQLTFLWNEFVDSLDDGARILDLATGNGIVAVNCISRARVRNMHLQVDAVDAADINPRGCVKHPGSRYSHVSFFGGIQLENLPFAIDCFSGVVSQFGFEYADEEQAISEISRVLTPGGKLRLVVHAKDGVISNDIGQHLNRLNSVLAENGPVSLVLELARAFVSGDTTTVRRKSEYIPAATKLTQRLAEKPLQNDSALFYSSEFLKLWAQRSRYRPEDLLSSIEQGWCNASGTARRQSQMLCAARSERDIERVCKRFETAGLTIDSVSPIQDCQRNLQNSWMISGWKR